MNDKKLTAIEEKLDTLVKLVGFRIAKDMGLNVSDVAPVFKRLGLSNEDIASILGSTPNAVSVRISEAKREKKPRSK